MTNCLDDATQVCEDLFICKSEHGVTLRKQTRRRVPDLAQPGLKFVALAIPLNNQAGANDKRNRQCIYVLGLLDEITSWSMRRALI